MWVWLQCSNKLFILIKVVKLELPDTHKPKKEEGAEREFRPRVGFLILPAVRRRGAAAGRYPVILRTSSAICAAIRSSCPTGIDTVKS